MKKKLSSSIALIYCYLVCFTTMVWILINGGMVLDKVVRLTTFSHTYSAPNHLRYTYFHAEAQKNKEGGSNPHYNKELKEKERKNRIEDDKDATRKSYLREVYLHLSYLFLPIIFLGIHSFFALQIRRNHSE